MTTISSFSSAHDAALWLESQRPAPDEKKSKKFNLEINGNEYKVTLPRERTSKDDAWFRVVRKLLQEQNMCMESAKIRCRSSSSGSRQTAVQLADELMGTYVSIQIFRRTATDKELIERGIGYTPAKITGIATPEKVYDSAQSGIVFAKMLVENHKKLGNYKGNVRTYNGKTNTKDRSTHSPATMQVNGAQPAPIQHANAQPSYLYSHPDVGGVFLQLSARAWVAEKKTFINEVPTIVTDDPVLTAKYAAMGFDVTSPTAS